MIRSRTARLGARFSVALLAVTLLGAGASPTAGTLASGGDKEECDTSHSFARVGKGSDGKDPNSVTEAQAAALDKSLMEKVEQLKKDGTLDRNGSPTTKGGYTINTYVHVITRSNGAGDVTNKQIADQMQVINDGYAGRTGAGAAATPFRFVVKGIDRTANNDWYDWSLYEDNDDQEAKTRLHRGSMADLNIYIANLQDGLLGYAYYPRTVPLALDGLVILNESMPGGDAAPYNGGDTATHEIGHWLGLLHTFENGCNGAGDHVNDTPAQLDGENIFYCNESDDTCPKQGTDPVHNFMSYGDDDCLDRFTAGQSQRQVWNWLGFRRGR
jgi:Pregnancy-associated plasma protein-A